MKTTRSRLGRWQKYIFCSRLWHSISPAAMFGLLLACTACAVVGGDLEHGLSVANKGESKIFNVVIRYGKITRNECTKGCLPRSGGGVWNAPMPIPDSMQVSWQTADGQQHQLDVPVKSRIKDARRLNALYLEFRGAQLLVKQGLQYDNPTLVGLEEFPLFP